MRRLRRAIGFGGAALAIVVSGACTTKGARTQDAPTQAPTTESPTTEGAGAAPIAEPAPEPVQRPAPEPVPTPAPEAPVTAAPVAEAPVAEAPAAAPSGALTPVGGLKEIFPGVRVDASAKVVEFDGEVPIDVNDPDAPLVYLELVACTPDTREHESLVMTRADAAHVHAALLLIGLEPGKPGSWSWDGANLQTIPPTGPGLEVSIVTRDGAGAEVVATPESWIVSARDGKRFGTGAPDGKREGAGGPGGAGSEGGWVFAGSMVRMRQGREVYEAQGAGTLIGLTTFGSETIAWKSVISPEAAIDEPVWIADKAVVPKIGTPVTVRIRPKP